MRRLAPTQCDRSRARFRLYDSGGSSDRYTVLDTEPDLTTGWRLYAGFSAAPSHPQGIGQHGEFSPEDWRRLRASSFVNLGRRIWLENLPTEDARVFVRRFMGQFP